MPLNFSWSIAPSESEIKSLAKKYYTIFIKSSPISYSLKNLVDLFSTSYQGLARQDKIDFELNISYCFDSGVYDYELENSITKIVSPIWNDLAERTRGSMMMEYISIYISDRQDKFPQKAFSKKLLEDKLIPESVIAKWVNDRLKKLKFKNMLDDDTQVYQLSKKYKPLAKSLNVKQSEWIDYVRERINKII